MLGKVSDSTRNKVGHAPRVSFLLVTRAWFSGSFLNMKIQEGEAHNIFCPAYDCFQLVPVEVIESVVSREMDKRYLQFDIKVKDSRLLVFSGPRMLFTGF